MRVLSDAAVILVFAGALAHLSACSKSAPVTAAQRGRQVYMSNCIACHNPNPTKPGSQGPAVAGSSRELLEARILHASYPAGYKPQRTTKAMVVMPHLASKIDDLAAFLAPPRNGAS